MCMVRDRWYVVNKFVGHEVERALMKGQRENGTAITCVPTLLTPRSLKITEERPADEEDEGDVEDCWSSGSGSIEL